MKTETQVGIAAAVVKLPSRKRAIRDLLQEETATFDLAVIERLGIDQVPFCDGESASTMALAACQEALCRAELDAAQVDLIVDYSILPQEYLVPAWNMSNKLQHELGAKKAFTVGFSGGGASNFLVALSSAVAILQANEKLISALLVAGDVAIPGNRILNPAAAVTVFGDSAGAMVLKKGINRSVIIGTELHSEGSYHDVCYIPGGALANPEDSSLYRMKLDKARYEKAPKHEKLRTMLASLLKRSGLRRDDIVFGLYPNLSWDDQRQFAEAVGLGMDQIDRANLKSYGHLQGTDFVLNYLSLVESARMCKDQYVVAASHGMAFLAGVSVIQM